MKYDVEAEWHLLNTCNFRCSYCFFSNDFLSSKKKIYGTSTQWLEGFNSTGKTWLLFITGGEPSIYPDFVELCEKLTQQHYVSFNTNLTHHCLEAFIQRINPSRIHFINASIHFEERQKRGGLNTFIERVHKLQEAKFKVLLSLVMTPQMVCNFPKISEYLEAQGLVAIPKVLRSTFENKCYPLSYSMEERRVIDEFITKATIKYEPLVATMSERPTFNMDDRILLNGVKDYRGMLCGAGSKFVTIYPNGTVFRCQSFEIYGNILFKNVKLLDAPKICDTTYCTSFCEKYSIQDKIYHVQLPSSHLKLKRKMIMLKYLLRTDGWGYVSRKIFSKFKNRLIYQ